MRGNNMRIDEIMSSPAITIDESISIVEAAKIMKEKNIGFLPITKDGFITGVITDRDITIRAVSINDVNDSISSIMTPHPLTVVSGTEVITTAKLMANEKIRRVVVTLDGKIIGVATSKDLLKAPNTLQYALMTYQVSDVSPYFRIYANSNPHDSVKVEDYRL